MSNTAQNETHNVCNERLKREGGKATCCDCDPHEGCTLGERLPEASKTFKPLEYYREKYTQQQLDEAVADARKEVIAQKIEKIEKIINQKYPPNIFTEYTGDPNVMTMSRGVAESTHIRRLDQSEIGHIAFLEHILATLREEEHG